MLEKLSSSSSIITSNDLLVALRRKSSKATLSVVTSGCGEDIITSSEGFD